LPKIAQEVVIKKSIHLAHPFSVFHTYVYASVAAL